ncbi:MAG: response regulator transcription factor [Chloroflexales bacterium]|nr:response regulator transcription factor [Chloroflexales bacterium]
MGRIFLVAHHPGFRVALAVTIQNQSRQKLRIVGMAGWANGELGAIGTVQPDVVVLVVGLEAGSELRRLSQLRALAPGCQILVVDTLGEACTWQIRGWDAADALLHSEQLATELVPALCRLVAQGDRSPVSPSD